MNTRENQAMNVVSRLAGVPSAHRQPQQFRAESEFNPTAVAQMPTVAESDFDPTAA